MQAGKLKKEVQLNKSISMKLRITQMRHFSWITLQMAGQSKGNESHFVRSILRWDQGKTGLTLGFSIGTDLKRTFYRGFFEFAPE